jgi:hypothetical protein
MFPIYIKMFIIRKRILGLATQKFVSDIITDALAYSKLRQQGQKDKKASGKVWDLHVDYLYRRINGLHLQWMILVLRYPNMA